MVRDGIARTVVVAVLLIGLSISIAVAGADSDDGFEPNDDLDAAESLSPGHYEGLSAGLGDRDYFAIEAEAGDQVAASIDPRDSDARLRVAILNDSGDRFVFERSRGEIAYVDVTAPEDGTYYALVRPMDSAETGADYDLTLVRDAAEAGTGDPDRFEPNDQPASAPALDDGIHANLHLDEGDADYFAVPLERGDRLNASITFDHDRGDLDLSIHAPAASKWVRSNSRTDDEHATLVAHQDARYFVEVESPWGDAADYDLHIETGPAELNTTDQLDPNQDRDEAPVLAPGTYTDLRHAGLETEYYAVDLQAGQELTATLSFDHDAGDLEFDLEDADGDTHARSNSDTDDESLSQHVVAGGRYYLVVSSWSGTVTPYDLEIDVAGEGDGDRFDPNDRVETAAYVESSRYSDLVVDRVDPDVFAVNVTEGETLSATVDVTTADAGVEVSLLDGFGGEIWTESTTGGTATVSDVVNSDDAHYVRVRATGGRDADYDLTVNVTGGDRHTDSDSSDTDSDPGDSTPEQDSENSTSDPEPDDSTSPDDESTPDPDRYEPNDDLEAPTQLQPGEHGNLTLHDGDDTDVYAVSLERGEILHANASFGTSIDGIEITARTPTGERMIDHSHTGESHDIAFLAGRNGSYTVTVSQSSEAAHGYSLDLRITDRNITMQDRFEENDGPDTPVQIDPGQYSLLTTDSDDPDWYAVHADAGDRITFAISGPTTRLGWLHVDVVATGTAAIDEWEYRISPPRRTVVAQETGTYLLRIATGAPEPIPYNVTVSIDERADRFEPNDNRTTAAPVEPGTHRNLTITPDDPDVYAVEAAADQRITTSVEIVGGEDNIDITGWYPTNASVGAPSGDGSLSFLTETPGTHYVMVEVSNAPQTYNLSIAVEDSEVDGADRFEPNDHIGSAARLQPGHYEDLNLWGSRSEDWYAIDAEAGERIEVTRFYPPAYGEVDIKAWAWDGAIIDRPRGRAANRTVAFTAPAAGQYYLELSGVEAGVALYNLSVRVERPAVDTQRLADPFEPNDEDQQATPITPGTYEDLRIGNDTSDRYVLYLQEGDGISIDIAGGSGHGPYFSGVTIAGTYDDLDPEGLGDGRYRIEDDGFYQIYVPPTGTGPSRYDMTVEHNGSLDRSAWLDASRSLITAAPVERGETYDVDLSGDGARYAAITLPANESLTVHSDAAVGLTAFGPAYGRLGNATGELTFTARRAGVHYVRIGAASREGTVQLGIGKNASVRNGGGLPGFGHGVALAGLLATVVALLLGHRHRRRHSR